MMFCARKKATGGSFGGTPWAVMLATGSKFALVAAFASLASPTLAADIELHGAGSTFVAPLLGAWISEFEKSRPDVAIHYDVVGSGEGVARFQAGTVDFGASDAFLASPETAKIERGVVEVPITAGMIVLAYNLPEVKGQLKLPHDVYVDIFLGKIHTWDDPRIRAANPALHLPSISIIPVGRQNSSGTTYAFTAHLAAVNQSWSSGPGVGKLVQWPNVTMLARGNEGVASRIKLAQGAIGYVEYGFALRLGLPMAALENKAGQFVAPTPQSGAAALAPSAGVALDAIEKSTVNPDGLKAYPIVTFSWLLLYRKYPIDQARALSSLLDFALNEGQSYAAYFGYLSLPPQVAHFGKSAIAGVDLGAAISAPQPRVGSTGSKPAH